MLKFLKKNIINIIMALVFVVGVAVAAYPVVSNLINSSMQSGVIGNYDDTVKELPEKDLEKMQLAADLYNQELYSRQLGKMTGNYDYDNILNVDGNGLMGYIVIPAVDIKLPVYHGIGEEVLTVGVGHIDSSSLPVGGRNTHTVLLGHRGLPSAKLFNDLDKLTENDYFEIHVLDDVLYYKVYDIEVVLPEELNKLRIEKNKDLATLVTCTPYGINSHRLLIHGERIESPEAEHLIVSEAQSVNVVYVAIVIGIFLWLVLIIIIIYVSAKHKNRKISREEYYRRKEILNEYRRRRDNG
ncbi:MAG: class C sortase [Oscillospiraceae bacterium]